MAEGYGSNYESGKAVWSTKTTVFPGQCFRCHLKYLLDEDIVKHSSTCTSRHMRELTAAAAAAAAPTVENLRLPVLGGQLPAGDRSLELRLAPPSGPVPPEVSLELSLAPPSAQPASEVSLELTLASPSWRTPPN